MPLRMRYLVSFSDKIKIMLKKKNIKIEETSDSLLLLFHVSIIWVGMRINPPSTDSSPKPKYFSKTNVDKKIKKTRKIVNLNFHRKSNNSGIKCENLKII